MDPHAKNSARHWIVPLANIVSDDLDIDEGGSYAPRACMPETGAGE